MPRSAGYAIAGMDHSVTLNVPATAPVVTIGWEKTAVAHGVAFGGGLTPELHRRSLLYKRLEPALALPAGPQWLRALSKAYRELRAN